MSSADVRVNIREAVNKKVVVFPLVVQSNVCDTCRVNKDKNVKNFAFEEIAWFLFHPVWDELNSSLIRVDVLVHLPEVLCIRHAKIVHVPEDTILQ